MDIIRQGECGQNAKWSLTSENTLIILGEGRMKDYEIRSSYYDNGNEPFLNVINDDYLVPWRDYSNDITQIVIEEGITYIGSFAFCNFQSLESVILPLSLLEIGICSFADCPSLVDISINPDIKIAEWAFFGSQHVHTEINNTSFDLTKYPKELLEGLDAKVKEELKSIHNPIVFLKDPLLDPTFGKMGWISISHLGIRGHSKMIESQGFFYDIIDSPNPNDVIRKQIRESWKGHFFYGEAEEYFQSLFLDSYNKQKQLVNIKENNSVEIDNYYLSLLIKNAIIRYQYAQSVINLLDEVSEEDITDYIKHEKKRISLLEMGIKGPSMSIIAFRLGRLNEYLENVLDRKRTLSGLGFDNIEQVSNWLSSPIDSIDDDILCSDMIALNNLVDAYLDCQKKILHKNDRTKIAMWYLISSCKLTNHDYMSVDESYIGELKTKHQWFVNNLSFDILYKMMFPSEYGCRYDGWFDNVEVYLRKDVIDDYPLSSLYVEDELLRGANIYICELLKRDGLGPYLYREIDNDNKKNDILKYIGLREEYVDGVNRNAEFYPEVIYDSAPLSIVSKDGEESDLMNEQSEATTDECVETEGTSDKERNHKYPFVLHNRRRLRKKTLIDEVCKKYLSKWFKNKIDEVPYIKYVFFEYGTPTDNLVFTGKIKDLVSFLLFLNNGSGDDEIWNYIKQFIVKENGLQVLGNNPRSNVKEDLHDAIGRVRQEIRQAIDRKLNKEEEEDLK